MLATWAGAEQTAAKRVTLDGVIYRLEGGAAYIESFDYSAPRIEVHAVVDELPMMTTDVTALAYGKATELVLCEGIESIGLNSFSHWGSLETVYLPESFMQWGEFSFYNCPKELTFVVWPGSYAEAAAKYRYKNYRILGATEEDRLVTLDGVTYRLQDGAAYIESVDFLSERIEVHSEVDGLPMKTKAFYCNKSNDLDVPARVREVVLCEGIEVLGEQCFNLMCDLERVVLPQSLWRIGIEAFKFTQSLQSLELPKGLTAIGNSAFFSSGFQEIVIPEGVLQIGGSTFENTCLMQVVLPDSLQSIGYLAFTDTQLTEVRIPSGVLEIGPNAFLGCKDLSAIEVDPKNESFSSVDGVLFDKTGNYRASEYRQGYKRLVTAHFLTVPRASQLLAKLAHMSRPTHGRMGYPSGRNPPRMQRTRSFPVCAICYYPAKPMWTVSTRRQQKSS